MRRELFPARSVAYLDTAAEGLPPLTVEAALDEYWREKSRGTPGRRRHYEVQAETEALAAQMIGADPSDMVLLGNASDALNLLAESISWRPDDEVLISDLEFPSAVVVWLRLGVRVVVVPTVNGETRLEDWTSRINTRTQVVAVSQVSYKSGTQVPFFAELAEAAHAAGALFCVDATQALGRVPVNVQGVDFLVASSYKWLLGTHGLGVVYLSPEVRQRMPPPTAGWYSVESLFRPDRFSAYTPKSSAGRLQAGMPNFPGIYALKAGLECLLDAGVAEIDKALSPLIQRMRTGIASLGYTMLTPPGREYASGIVSFECDRPEAVMAALADRGVIVWGGDGRVRTSLHLYNDGDDVERCLSALREIGERDR